MKAKLKNYKKYKREIKSMNLIWTTKPQNTWQMPPFIGQNSELLIWWIIVEWVPHLTWWKSLSSCLNKTKMLPSELGPLGNMIVVGNWLSFPGKKMEVIWTSRTPDMGQTLNSIRAAGQIRTSLLSLWFGLENDLVRFLCSNESCRPMSQQVCVKIWDHLDI